MEEEVSDGVVGVVSRLPCLGEDEDELMVVLDVLADVDA